MLQAKTEEQKNKIEEILASVELWELDGDDGLFINDSISFDKLAELIDYLRSVNKPKKAECFVKPTIDEIQAHILEKGYTFDAEAFYAFYESNGWKVGKNSMKNWKMACTTWAKNRKNNNNNVNYGRETITDKIRRSVEEANIFSQQLTERIGNQQQADVRGGDDDEVW